MDEIAKQGAMERDRMRQRKKERGERDKNRGIETHKGMNNRTKGLKGS